MHINRNGDGAVAGEFRGWVIVYRPADSGAIWKHYKIRRANRVRRKNGQRRSFTIAFDGDRFARTSEYAVLAEEYPDLLQFADRCIRAFSRP